MIDVERTVLEYLRAQPDLTALVGARLYAHVNLPPGYDPAQGPALIFGTRGGRGGRVLIDGAMQFRAYGQNPTVARQVDRALFDALMGANTYLIRAVTLDVLGQLLVEPESNWPFVLSFYTFSFANP